MAESDELKRIDALHLKDMKASKAGDYKTLRSILSDDAVVLPPGANPIQGKETHDKNFDAMDQSGSSHEVLDYQLKFEETKVIGDYAFEWGSINSTSKDKVTGKINESRYNVVRILRKENGEWKVYRSIWNDGEKTKSG